MAYQVSTEGRGALAYYLTGATSTDAGGIAAIPNPEGAPILITRATLYVESGSTGNAALSIGVAANATTSDTDILNALDTNGADGKVYNGFVMQNGAKTEISAPTLWSSDKYLTVTGAADSSGFVGYLFLEYLRVG